MMAGKRAHGALFGGIAGAMFFGYHATPIRNLLAEQGQKITIAELIGQPF